MKLLICLADGCTWTAWERPDTANIEKHASDQPGHSNFKTVNAPPAVLRNSGCEVQFDRIRWNVQEATLDSAVFNNLVDGTQTVAVRLVLSRKPSKMKAVR